MRFRVYCSFVVEADSSRDVFQFLGEESNFVESHITIFEDSPAIEQLPPHSTEEVYADIRK